MSNVQEPDIEQGSKPEETFHKAVIKAVENLLEQKKVSGSLVNYFILQDFGLDIAVFMKWSNNRFTVRFFELKAFIGSRQGGVGFGNQQGKGSQVDILLLENSQLNLANQFIRWLLVDGTKPKGSSRFIIFDNIQAKNAAMGGVRRGKQNNFRINTLVNNATTWDNFLKELEDFLTSQG
ncbi:hypothetical protein [Thermodesulfatator autotrophicus]|uniref:Uncharacterized protein n=1 Tax=Thermodesulfatator autotrophicus TaxID=1795632 RepID=A0A177E7Q3_9BACT|nr:hypothetical protein [Thermodesulfatator autotrophicus]OAG27974.1 hypothetical protein TH606_04360 [Thermodesulfatator autotrophicus]